MNCHFKNKYFYAYKYRRASLQLFKELKMLTTERGVPMNEKEQEDW